MVEGSTGCFRSHEEDWGRSREGWSWLWFQLVLRPEGGLARRQSTVALVWVPTMTKDDRGFEMEDQLGVAGDADRWELQLGSPCS